MLAFKFHPDRNPGNQEAEDFFKEIQYAYDILGNTEKRKKYDLGFHLFKRFDETKINHYFFATIDAEQGKLNEEFRLSFTYSGEGRLFKKPDLKFFFITGPPFVSFSQVMIDGTEVRETTLTYIICPLTEGTLQIDRAFIKISGKTFFTNAVEIFVLPAKCFFSKSRIADGKPLQYKMYYEAAAGTDKVRTMKNVNHTVLIPRSHFAKVQHNIGLTLKMVMLCWGIYIAILIHKPIMFGMIAGLLFGGITCHILYFVSGVKSKFYFARKSGYVQHYLTKGYQSGTDSGSQFISSEFIYWINALLF